jgi:hypothetical protein
MTAIERQTLGKAEHWIISEIKHLAGVSVSPWELRQRAPMDLRAGMQMALVELISSGRVVLEPNQEISLPKEDRGTKK